jgi:hypothetical protein
MYPTGEIFLTCLLNKRMAVNLDIVMSLSYIDAIEHIQVTFALIEDGQAVVQHVKEYIRSALIGGSNCKVINLRTLENNKFTINSPQIQAWLMDRRDEAKVAKDGICVILPEMWGLWMPLHH